MKNYVGRVWIGMALALFLSGNHASFAGEPSNQSPQRTASPAFQVPSMWEYSAPLIAPKNRAENPSHAQKDPTVVFFGGKWHVFMTIKLSGRSVIEYCSFEN